MIYHSIYPQASPQQTNKKSSSSVNPQPIKFPEDVQVILRSDRNNYGNLYIGNLESAQNV